MDGANMGFFIALLDHLISAQLKPILVRPRIIPTGRPSWMYAAGRRANGGQR